jgi:hypothetical protein
MTKRWSSTRSDLTKPKRQASKERRRMFPDDELKEPVKKFEDTFSAQTVVLEAFGFKKADEK